MNKGVAFAAGTVLTLLAAYSLERILSGTHSTRDTVTVAPGDVALEAPAVAGTREIVAATSAFLTALTADQRAKVQFPFDPSQKPAAAVFPRTGGAAGGPGRGGRGDSARGPGGRGGMDAGFVGERYGAAVWSNYPVSDVPRTGLKLGDLNASQDAALMHLLQVLLSPAGYQKVLDIMGSDQALSEGGTNFSSGRAVYTVGIFGTPSVTAPWMIAFGGHHLALNVVIIGERGVITPTLTGAQPSVYTSNGKTVRVLAQENDKGFALLDALDATQRKQAILNYTIGDLVVGPGHSGETIVPEGLKGSTLNAKQRALLVDLISEWAGIVQPAYATPRIDEIKRGLDDTYFAWSGPTTHEAGRNGAAYYRIQGPKLIIEFSPQGVGGDPTMHVHTMYRDPTNDYGQAYTAK